MNSETPPSVSYHSLESARQAQGERLQSTNQTVQHLRALESLHLQKMNEIDERNHAFNQALELRGSAGLPGGEQAFEVHQQEIDRLRTECDALGDEVYWLTLLVEFEKTAESELAGTLGSLEEADRQAVTTTGLLAAGQPVRLDGLGECSPDQAKELMAMVEPGPQGSYSLREWRSSSLSSALAHWFQTRAISGATPRWEQYQQMILASRNRPKEKDENEKKAA